MNTPKTSMPLKLAPRLAPLALALSASLLLAACNTAPERPELKVEIPAEYKEAAAAQSRWQVAQPAEAQARGEWWLAFKDPTLTTLVQQAEAGNPGVAAATARVQSARSLLNGAEAARLPQLNLQAGATRQRQAPAQLVMPADATVTSHSLWQVGLGASYEVDLFQRVGNGVRAADADAQASEAGLRSVLLALQADVAQTYFQLRTLDAEVDLLSRSLALREQTLGLIEKRRAAGDVGELDVVRARAERATTRAELQALQGQRQRSEHALALLLGQAPSAFRLQAVPLPADVAVPQVPAGLPSSLLERRPDVAAAQGRVMATNARLGQARAALFPALVLNAQSGGASYALADLLTWNARTWLVSAVLNLPLFDGGRNQAAITRAEATLAESVADYRQVALQAFGDVEGQLSNLATVRAQAESVDEALVASRRSTELADKRYRAGEDSYLTLLDTQRSLLSAERQSVQLRGAWAGQTVGLVRALGGGW